MKLEDILTFSLGFALALFVMLIVIAIIIFFGWNYVAAPLFDLQHIDFIQATGGAILVVIIRLLFR